jgi:hypothetical protein
MRVAEDYDMSTRLIFADARAGLLLEPLLVYRLRLESLSHNRTWAIEGRIAVLTKLLACDLDPSERAVAEKKVAEYWRVLAWVEVMAAAKASLLERNSDIRRKSFRVAIQGGLGFRIRLKAAVAMMAPQWATRHIRP